MREHRQRVLAGGLAIVLTVYVALYAVLLHLHGRYVAVWLYVAGLVVFAGLLALLRGVTWSPRTTAWVVLGAAVVLQVVALTAHPTTSDDVYRYLWDGRVQFHGVDPYRYPPQAAQLSHLRDHALFPSDRSPCTWKIPDGCTLINRPSVRSVYPPIAELVFDLGWLVSLGGHGGALTFQLLAAIGVLAVSALLVRRALRRGQSVWPVAVWAWSPLVVIEFGNNAHVDWVAVLLALLCLEAGARGRAVWAGALLGAVTLTKLYPALVGPSLLRRRPWTVLVSAAVVAVLSYVPHVLAVGTDVIGYLPGYLKEEGYDSGSRLLLLGVVFPHPVDTAVGVLILVAVALWAWRRSNPDMPELTAVVLVGVALLVTTPSYGWYAGLLLGLAVAARRFAWVPVALAPSLVYVLRTQVTHATWPGSSVYLVAGCATAAVLARQAVRGRSRLAT